MSGAECLTCLCYIEEEQLLDQKTIAMVTKYFWFTKRDLRTAVLCSNCLDNIRVFNKFYTSVERLYADLADLKMQPDTPSIDFVDLSTPAPLEKTVKLNIETMAAESAVEVDESSYPEHIAETDDGTESEGIEDGVDADEYIKRHVQFICEICCTISDKFSEHVRHGKVEHRKKIFVACCGNRFYRRCRLYEHVQQYFNPKAFRCTTCQKCFRDKEGIKRHIKEKHATGEVKEYQCPRCPKRFVMNYKLQYHLRCHEDIDNDSCTCHECGKTFCSRTSLATHIKLKHIKPKEYVCDICAKDFPLHSKFVNHMKTHGEPEEPVKLQCNFCLKWLKNKLCLSRHMQRHQQSEAKCDICGHISPNSVALNNHKGRVHSAQRKKFECDSCDKVFLKRITLNEHVAAQHRGTPLYSCVYCDKKFHSHANLYTHRKKKHRAEWEEVRHVKLLKEMGK